MANAPGGDNSVGDENRKPRMSDDFLGRAAEDKLLQPAVSIGSHDQHARVLFQGMRLQRHPDRLARPRRRGMAALDAVEGEEGMELGCSAGSDGMVVLDCNY